jgi:hypothetical protein
MDGNTKNKNVVWTANINDIIEIYEEAVKLARERGKKPGDSINQEVVELLAKRKKNLQCLGTTNKDMDMLTGDLREAGFKVINTEEERRRKKNGK